MNRWARPDNFGHPIRNPLLKRHVVYRAFSADGDLLYVGCTYDPEKRMATHRTQSDWYPLMARLAFAGPYNYETARELEHRALATERPLWAFGPDRRAVIAAYRRIFNRHMAVTTGDFTDRIHQATAHAQSLIAYPGNRAPFRITDLTVAAALRADRADLATYQTRETA